jgi:ABC-2 type transport system ATP-binding protein
MGNLNKNYNILSSSFDGGENQLDFRVQLPSSHTAGILAELSSMANVNRFEETIPSANDIFIQTVNNKDNDR